MDDRKPTALEFIAGVIMLTCMFALLYWGDIKRSDIYQRHFDPDYEQKRIEGAARISERRARDKELDELECQIKLRAIADLVPVEIERSTLMGISHEHATKLAMEDLNAAKSMCASGMTPVMRSCLE